MSDVILERHESVLELRLARASKKNALTHAMYRSLNEGLASAQADEGIRAVVFTAEGTTFCGGNDVNDFLAGIGEEPPVLRFLERLATFDKPLVAAVQGPAVGLGATMLLHCDLVYAAVEARLLVPFVALGLVPEAASSLLLPRRVGMAVASEMILLGSPLDAARARELGLVNAIVDGAELRGHALARAGELAKKPPNALRVSRALLRGNPKEILERIHEEAGLFVECLASDEARNAFMAFLAKKSA
jgi:enoyl-CoA hydratase/carnithine racemase